MWPTDVARCQTIGHMFAESVGKAFGEHLGEEEEEEEREEKQEGEGRAVPSYMKTCILV